MFLGTGVTVKYGGQTRAANTVQHLLRMLLVYISSSRISVLMMFSQVSELPVRFPTFPKVLSAS